MHSLRQIRNLALIGFMATGKSSVGRLAAQQLQFDFIDTDNLIESRLCKSIPNIFAQEGEAWFRQYERQLVLELDSCSNTVIAAGGGLAANAANLNTLKQHALVICLWASPEIIWSRARRHSHRPLLRVPDPLARIRQLLAERSPVYRQADVLVNTERRPLKKVAQQVIQQFNLAIKNPPAA